MNIDYYGNLTITLAMEQWVGLILLIVCCAVAGYIAVTHKGGLIDWIKENL